MTVVLRVGNQPYEEFFNPEWKIGSCYGPQRIAKYKAKSIYFDRCCLRPGIYTLVCKNDKGPYGWGNSSLEILGQRYCDDFVGYKGLRRVAIAGK